MPTSPAQIEYHQLTAVASVHARAFPDSALTRLGLEAVRRYYDWQLRGPHEHHFIGIFEDGVLAGFAVGGRARGALAGFVKQNRWFLLRQIALNPRLVFSQRGRKAMVSGLRAVTRFAMKPKTSPPARNNVPQNSFGILAIAVDPRYQGKGIGYQLMEHLEHIARAHRFTRMHLSVNVSNAQAIRFYERLSWVKPTGHAIWNGSMEKSLM